MPEFLTLQPPKASLELLLDSFKHHRETENIASLDALDRILAKPILSNENLPAFPRSTVDGYAVRARDTFGASESLPAYLNMIGEVSMGAAAEITLKENTCALIHTGGMIPANADAVVMVENTQQTGKEEIEILKAVAPGENVIEVGEDVEKGSQVIPPGVRVRPAEIGGLMALGIQQVDVFSKPVVGIISSGDEVIPPQETPKPGQVRDINAYTIGSLVKRAGGIPKNYGIVSDNFDSMFEAASAAVSECDLVVITAGSSASTRDLTSEVVSQLGEPGVLVHGVNVRPGKPTILGVCKEKPVIGLPGNPVSALVIAWLFVVPVVEKLSGLKELPRKQSIECKLALNLSSQTGREDWVPVQLVPENDHLVAHPIFGKSNLIFTLARADGLLKIPADANGISAGETVRVYWI